MPEETKPPEQQQTGVATVDAVLNTVDAGTARVERYLKLGERYGWLPLILAVAYYQILLPLRDGNIEHIKASIEAQKESAVAQKETSAAVEGIKDAVETLTEARVAADVHFSLTKEIGCKVEAVAGDVQEIKAAVVPRGPRPTATPPRPYSAAGT